MGRGEKKKMKNIKTSAGLLLVIPYLFVGCATQNLQVKNADLKAFDDFGKITRIQHPTKTIYLNSITDNREYKLAVGTAFTGMSYEKTPVILSAPLTTFLDDYFKKEFANRKLVILPNGETQLTIVINKLWVNEIIEKFKPERAVCKANFTFYMQSPGQQWEGNMWTEITSPGDMGDGTEKIAPTLASCLNSIMEKLVKEPKFLKFITK